MTKCNKKSVTKFASLFIITLMAVGVANPDAAHGTLTGYWAFDGNYSDGSGNGHTATPHGDAALVGGGLFGGAVSLDGNGDWVDVADHADHEFSQGTDFSLTLFYNGPNSDTNNGLLTKGYANNPRQNSYYLLQVTSPDQFEFDSRCCAGGTPRFRTGQIGPDITDDQWHNVTVVRDYGASQFRSYIDGTLVHTAALNASNGGDWDMGVNPEALTIGDHLDRFTTGLFDDVAIFKGQVLSQSDIEFITNNGVAAFIGPAVPEPSAFALSALGLFTLGCCGWRRRRGSRARIAERAENNSKGTGPSVTSRIRPERNAATCAHILTTVTLVTTLLSVTCTYAAPLQVDLNLSGNPNSPTQAGYDSWSIDSGSSVRNENNAFAFGAATDGTVEVNLSTTTNAQGRNYGLSNITDPGNLTIPDVWRDQVFFNNNINGSMTLTFDDLKAGTYDFTSYSYANNLSDAGGTNDEGMASVFLDTGGGSVDTTLDVTFISGLNSTVAGPTIEAADLDAFGTLSLQFTVPNDNDTVKILYDSLTGGDTFGLNGFELEAQLAAVPEPSAFVLIALGLFALGCGGSRRRRRAI